VPEALRHSLRCGADQARCPGVLAGANTAKARTRTPDLADIRSASRTDDDSVEPAVPATGHRHIDLQALGWYREGRFFGRCAILEGERSRLTSKASRLLSRGLFFVRRPGRSTTGSRRSAPYGRKSSSSAAAITRQRPLIFTAASWPLAAARRVALGPMPRRRAASMSGIVAGGSSGVSVTAGRSSGCMRLSYHFRSARVYSVFFMKNIITAHEERLRQWRPFIREHLGLQRGGAVDYGLATNRFKALKAKAAPESISDLTMEDRQAIYHQLAGNRAPQAENAWWIGEALNEWLPWSSGLLGVYAAGHLGDFVGILGCIEISKSRELAENLSVLVNSAYAATYGDRTGGYERLRALQTPGIILPPSITREIERLTDRESARCIWEGAANGGMRTILDDAYSAWKRIRTNPRFSRYVGNAYTLARDRSFTYIERVQLVIRALTAWLHVEVNPEPPEFRLLFDSPDQLEFIARLDSPSARRAKLLFLMQYCASQVIENDDSWFPAGFAAADGIAGRPPGTEIQRRIKDARERMM